MQKHVSKFNSQILIIFLLFVSFSSHATNYYVSNSGNDSNSGTSAGSAWRTLEKVNSFVPSPGDQILFERGGQWVGTITVKASGTNGSPIVYGAYGSGSKPKIYGSQEITGWTQHSGNIYKASFSSEITQLFVNSSRVRPARYPNSGYFLVNNVVSSTQFSSSNLSSSIDYEGAKWLGRTNEWFSPTRDVIRSSGQTLTLNSSPDGSLGENEGFVLMNKLEFLDQAGEWYWDGSSNTVYLWAPAGGNPESYAVKGSVYDVGVKLNEHDYVKIENLNISNYQSQAINIASSSNVIINGNEIYNCEEFGIYSNGGSTSAIITNNTIDGVNGAGMLIWGGDMSVKDNVIKNIGLFGNLGLKGTSSPNGGNGMEISGGNNIIEYNTIVNTNYNGIFYRYDAIVQYNYINNACLVKDDGGGIYTGGDYSGSTVRYNIVNSVPGNWTATGYEWARSFGYGIYIDTPQKNVKVYGNTVLDCGAAGIYLHYNSGTEVYENTVFKARYGLISSKEQGPNSLHDNIIYLFGEDDYEANPILVSCSNTQATFSSNKYINHYVDTRIFRNRDGHYDFSGWKEATGQDLNSTFDGSPLADGEVEQLFYNNTKQSKTISLGSSIYRDIYGNAVSGSITLEPFTSEILIRTSSETSSSNQSPSIQNQTFETAGDLTLNEFIGQIAASDPDAGQSLTYSIVSGNNEELFYIDSETGEIFSNSNQQITQNMSVTFTVEVTDNDAEPLSANAIVTISVVSFNDSSATTNSDKTAPVVHSFSVPAQHNSLEVPILEFRAEDNVAVVSFGLTSIPSPPQGNKWYSSPPESFFLDQTGSKTLYAWAKDAAGNISTPKPALIEITLSDTIESAHYITITEGDDYNGWTESGVYKQYLTSQNGSDSIAIIHLTVIPLETETISAYEIWSSREKRKRNVAEESSGKIEEAENSLNSRYSITVYPNPVESHLNFRCTPQLKTHVQIIDNTGRMVLNRVLDSFEKIINLEHIPAGIYYLHAKNLEVEIVEKLIKK